MGCYPVDPHIRLHRTGVFVGPSFPNRLMWHSEIMKALLTKGLQREAAGRGTLALYTSVCPRTFSFPKRRSVLIVPFIIGCLRHYARVHHLPYHASCTLDRWNNHHHELGDLYHCTTHSSSALTRAHSNVVDKEKGCYQTCPGTGSLTAYAIMDLSISDSIVDVGTVCGVVLATQCRIIPLEGIRGHEH